MRIEPEGSLDSAVSIITQIAVQVGSDRVTFAPNRGDVVSVNGVPTAISTSAPLVLSGGTITEISSDQYRVALNTGEVVTVDPFGDGMGLAIALAPTDKPGSVQGFLGPDEGQAKDFQFPDGTVLPQPLTQDQLYHQFADAWRVTDANSLLDYGPGQTTATFTNTAYPREILTLADFSPVLVAQAALLAAAAGITDPTLAADAEFDYLSMGNPSYFSQDAAVAALNPATPTPAVITHPASPPPSIGLLPVDPEIVEAKGATTPVTFLVNLTSAATTATVVDYTVASPASTSSGKSFLTAADFGGSLPSGSVTIAAGQTTAAITVDVPNSAIGTSPDKWILLTASAPGGNLIYSPAGQAEIINSQPVAGTPANPVIELLSSGAGTLTHTGNAYTLDLGEVTKGTTLAPLQFAVANEAAPSGDSVDAQISAVSGSGFQSSSAQPGTIMAGSAYQGLYFQPDTSTPGVQSATLTLSSKDVNDSGYSANLPNTTLTVKETVVAAPTLSGFDGDQVSLAVYYPNITPADVIGAGSATVAAGTTTFPSLTALGNGVNGTHVADGSLTLSGDTMTFLYSASEEGTTFVSAPANTYELQTAAGDPAITAASIISTNIPGLTAADLSFSAHKVDLNVAGLTLPSKAQGSIVLGFTFAGQSSSAAGLVAHAG